MYFDPSIAKGLALDFLKLAGQEIVPSNMARTVGQVKKLLAQGYDKHDIEKVMERAFEINPGIYSFGYIATVIDKLLADIRAEELREKAKLERDALEKEQRQSIEITRESEVVTDDEVSERNRRKAERLGIQSRERTKSYFDLFEG